MSVARTLSFACLMVAAGMAMARDPVLAPPSQALPPSVQAMRDDLQRIVTARDVQALRAHVRDATTLSFGGDAGPQGFDALWLRDADATRELWRILEEVLALPGVARQEDGEAVYCAPYVYCLPYAGDPDVFEAQVVLGRDVAVRAKPDLAAPVVTRVSHAVLTRVDDAVDGAGDSAWTRVRLASGQAGYIATRLLRSPIDYRISLVREGARGWAFQYFVAGD